MPPALLDCRLKEFARYKPLSVQSSVQKYFHYANLPARKSLGLFGSVSVAFELVIGSKSSASRLGPWFSSQLRIVS